MLIRPEVYDCDAYLVLVIRDPCIKKEYRQIPLYGHLIITDSLLCPWAKKALTFSLNSTRLIRTPCE